MLGACAALAASGCDGSDARPTSRCGRSYVADGAWVGVGAGAGIGYGVGWYDPGDVYNPSVDYGTYDPESDPGSSGDEPGDTPTGDDARERDTSGDGSGGWDSTESVTRLHFTAESAQTRAAAANGCFTCTLGCVAGEGAGATGRRAVGASDASYDDACDAAMRSLGYWAHAAQHQRLQTCQRLDATSSTRTPATPTVAARAR